MSAAGRRYAVIYTDPPWPQEKGNARKARPNQGKKLDYPVLPLNEIMEAHGPFFARAAEKHNVFMWTIDRYLHDAERMMAERGYKLHARLVWDKENGIAPAFTVRFSHEYLLWFYLPGRMLMPVKEYRGKYTTVVREPSTSHSAKPQAVYEMLERLFPEGNRIELFARKRRDGWDCWGNEVPGLPGAD